MSTVLACLIVFLSVLFTACACYWYGYRDGRHDERNGLPPWEARRK